MGPSPRLVKMKNLAQNEIAKFELTRNEICVLPAAKIDSGIAPDVVFRQRFTVLSPATLVS